MPEDKSKEPKEAWGELVLRSSHTAVEVIVSLMLDKELKPELRLKAAESILDRVGECGTGAGRGTDAPVRFEGVLEEWSR